MKKDASFHMVLRSHVKKQSKIITALPEEIIFNILLLVPPHILYAVMRFVCRQWNRIINDPFFVTMLRAPTTTFLVQDPKFHGQFLHVRECDINIENINFQFPGYVLSTCDGLTLVRDRRYETTHRLCYIVNLTTKRMMTLPTMPLNEYRCCLAFAASSNTYKVVLVTEDRSTCFVKYQCAILTVNVDRAWRLINCAHIDDMSIFKCSLVGNSGFVYWGDRFFQYMVSLNIESESIKTISFPQMYLSQWDQFFLLPKGNTISYVYVYADHSIKVFVLKDQESEDWVEFPDLMVEEMRRELRNLLLLSKFDLRGRVHHLHPICWFKNEEKILFELVSGVTNSFVVCDVKTGDAFSFIMDIEGSIMVYGPHVKGLTSLMFPHLSTLTWISVLQTSRFSPRVITLPTPSPAVTPHAPPPVVTPPDPPPVITPPTPPPVITPPPPTPPITPPALPPA